MACVILFNEIYEYWHDDSGGPGPHEEVPDPEMPNPNDGRKNRLPPPDKDDLNKDRLKDPNRQGDRNRRKSPHRRPNHRFRR